MSDALITKFYKDADGDLRKFEIFRDDEPWNPRTMDDGNVGHLHLRWNGYSLGDNQGKNDLDETLEELAAKYIGGSLDIWGKIPNNKIMVRLQTKATDSICIMPCFIYEHSRLTISCDGGTYPYNDRFDSGCAGFIYTTRDDFERVGLEWSIEQARASLQGEIEAYDMYLRGDVYGFVDENGDSCWGFYSKKYGEELFEEIARESCHDFDNTKWYEESEVEENVTVTVERKLKEEQSNTEPYEDKALRYAERHGVIEYHVKGDKMIYYVSYPLERSTIKVVVNLDAMEEDERIRLKGYYPSYSSLIGGKYQANYPG